MKSISHDIDPGGDIELVLKNPNKQRIVPKDTTQTSHGKPDHPELVNPPCLGRYRVFSELYLDDENQTPEEVEVHIRVSSRHLILASRVFRAMLEGPWKEGNSSSGPFRQISAEDWDAFALAIVLDSIHGRHHGMPTKIQLGLLARIATIVDYYQCREAMHFNYKACAHYKTVLPWQNDATALQLYVSWVFHDYDVFQNVANSALRHGKGMSSLNTHDLPVSGILTQLDDIRQTQIKKVLESLDFLQEKMTEEEGCEEQDDPDCSAINLGILIPEKRQLARYDPPLVAPFDGHSLNNMLDTINDFYYPRIPHSEDLYFDKSVGHHPCSIQGRLKPTLAEIDHAVLSISLADFQPKYTRHENL